MGMYDVLANVPFTCPDCGLGQLGRELQFKLYTGGSRGYEPSLRAGVMGYKYPDFPKAPQVTVFCNANCERCKASLDVIVLFKRGVAYEVLGVQHMDGGSLPYWDGDFGPPPDSEKARRRRAAREEKTRRLTASLPSGSKPFDATLKETFLPAWRAYWSDYSGCVLGLITREDDVGNYRKIAGKWTRVRNKL